MTGYRLISQPRADVDVEAAFDWYENERSGLGSDFLHELRATYDRIADGPLKYQILRSGIRRALLKRFPYAVYFAIDDDIVIVLAVLHASRDPAGGSADEANKPMQRTALRAAAEPERSARRGRVR